MLHTVGEIKAGTARFRALLQVDLRIYAALSKHSTFREFLHTSVV